MRFNPRTLLCAVAAVSAAGSLAWAAGSWSTLPIVGSPSFCGSIIGSGPSQSGITGQGAGAVGVGAGTICGETIPAGPPTASGTELIPADTGSAGGAPPQTVVIPSALLGPQNAKVNRLVGGDFGTNLWQRGTTPLSGVSPTAARMSADRWWAISASNVVTISKNTPATTDADYLGNIGFYSWQRVARPSGTPSGATCVGQTLEKQAAAPLIGNNAIFSFYGYAPTTFSATNQQIVVTVAYFTAADAVATQSTIGFAGGNSSTFALSSEGAGGGITGYQAAVTVVSMPSFTTGTVASGAATIPLTQTPTRYAVAAPIPVTNAAGTAVTSVGVSICMTPTLTTTVSTDYFEFTAAQLQAMPSAGTVSLPNGVLAPTGFERRSAEQEQELQLYYSYVAIESATTIQSRAVCHFTTANSAMQCPIVYPVPLRIAPLAKYTTGFQGFTTTAETTANACTGLATDATVTFVPSVSQTMVQCTIASGTAAAVGLSMTLWDLGTGSATGVMQFSAEP